MHPYLGTHDILFITLDTLRLDVAQRAWAAGQLPHLSRWLPAEGWEVRHTPGSFTYAAHQAFFAGFLPTPARPGKHPRLWATRFAGSETTTAQTVVFDTPDIVSGFQAAGYYTICIGGVGFFNQQTPLSRVLPSLFHESHWSEQLGVTSPTSTTHQVALTLQRWQSQPAGQRLFTFINVSALHQPNYFFLPGATTDSPASQQAALAYVDQALAPLWHACQNRAPTLVVICSDHGTAYGEDGYTGHRVGHAVVWTVPYAEFILPHG